MMQRVREIGEYVGCVLTLIWIAPGLGLVMLLLPDPRKSDLTVVQRAFGITLMAFTFPVLIAACVAIA